VSGVLYGVGLGPGDPELMTLKSARVLREAKVVAYFSRRGSASRARSIAGGFLHAGQEEIPLAYPVTTEFPAGDARYAPLMEAFYQEAAGALATRLSAGQDIAVLCEGDPFFYGSFMHLHIRLADRFECRVVPGVTGMSGCWTAAGTPMVWGSEVLCVLPGTLPTAVLAERLKGTDAAALMKLGRNLPRVREALAQAGLLERAIYVEYGSTPQERVVRMVEKTDDVAPYFSIILVPGKGNA